LCLTDPSLSNRSPAISGRVLQLSRTHRRAFKASFIGQPNTNSFKFTGREDDGLGLYYYRARYYSPTLQRFISTNPIGFTSGDTNLYSYVGNSPTNFTDPSGEIIPLLAAALIGGAIGGGVGYLAGWKLTGRKITWRGLALSMGAGAAIGLGIYGTTTLLSGLGANQVTSVGFRSFTTLKRFVGPAGAGMHWHHVVEQRAGNIARFGAEAIHNTANIVKVPATIHVGADSISAYYSRVMSFTNGLTYVRGLVPKHSKRSIGSALKF
jgi:RHS repeat-associated protein